MADWNQPTNQRDYALVLDDLKGRDESAAKLDFSEDTNLPAGIVRYNRSQNRFEEWSGSNWVALQIGIGGGGTGADSAEAARAALGANNAANLTTGTMHQDRLPTVPIAKGGTGATTAQGARTNLELGDVAVEDVVPVAKGGTGAVNAAAARTNLSVLEAGTGSAQSRTNAQNDGRFLRLSENLADIADAAAARSNLGVEGYEEATISLGGDFGSGAGSQVRIAKIGRLVVITSIGTLTHTSSGNPLSTAGIIPAAYRPSDTVSNAFGAGAPGTSHVLVSSTGVFAMIYRDWSGASRSVTSSANIVSIAYTV